MKENWKETNKYLNYLIDADNADQPIPDTTKRNFKA